MYTRRAVGCTARVCEVAAVTRPGKETGIWDWVLQDTQRGKEAGRRRRQRHQQLGKRAGAGEVRGLGDWGAAAVGDAGRLSSRAPRDGGGREPGEGGRRDGQVHLNIRLCHTRGAADNFITSAYKNDCRGMQMALASRPPASVEPRSSGRRHAAVHGNEPPRSSSPEHRHPPRVGPQCYPGAPPLELPSN
jgi:hypothetical protein